MTDIKLEIQQLNQEIIDAHNAHYTDSPTGLVDPKESPNGNIIYHLYSTGEIGYQKGGWAYMQRSEFTAESRLSPYQTLGLKFPKEGEYGTTYAILTEEECTKFRLQMRELIKK